MSEGSLQLRELQNGEEELAAAFVARQEFTPIWQAPLWGAFREQAVGERPRRFGVLRQGKLLTYVQVLERQWPLGLKFWFIERGPLLNVEVEDQTYLQAGLRVLWEGLQKVAQEEGLVGARFDFPPGARLAQATEDFFPALRAGVFSNFPQLTLRLNLRQSEEKIWAAMKPKARYNFRVACRQAVRVREITDPQAAPVFYRLLQKTTARAGFRGHGELFYQNFLRVLGPKQASLFLATQGATPLAAVLLTFYGDTATYYFGASDYRFRALMAPYACQFAALLAARQRGYHFYDLLGIAPAGARQHPLAGVSTFKRKFGGEVVAYPPAREVIWRRKAFALARAGRRVLAWWGC